MGSPGAGGASNVGRQSSEAPLIHVDTSFLIRSLVAGTDEDAAFRQRLRNSAPLAISSIAWTEFLCGPVDARVKELAQSLFRDVVPFGPEEAAVAAHLFNASGRRRGTLIDCMVAAVAMTADASLATSNLADFRRLEPLGLRLER